MSTAGHTASGADRLRANDPKPEAPVTPRPESRRRRRRLGRRADRRRQGRRLPPEEGLPRPLVLHARRDRHVLPGDLPAHWCVPDLLVRAERGAGVLRRLLHPAAGRDDVRGLCLDAGHLLRHPRRPDHPADPPLGGAAVHRGDHRSTCCASSSPARSASRARSTGSSAPCCPCSPWSRASPATRCRTTCSRAPVCARLRASCARSRSSGATSPTSSSTAPSRASRSSPACMPCTSCCCPRSWSACSPRTSCWWSLQKHTQFPGPGRTNENVVGYPVMPVYAAKAGGFFFIVFGVIALMSALVTINPIWAYGPYDPSPVTAGAQPDWYMGFADGALRLLPGFLEFDGLRLHVQLQRHDRRHPADPRAVRPAQPLPVPRAVGHRRQARAPPARPSAQRPDPHRAGHGRHDHLRRADVRGRQRHHGHQAGAVDQRHHPLPAGGVLHRPAHRVLGHQADLPQPAAPRPRPGPARP